MFNAAKGYVTGLYIEKRAAMKRIFKIRRVYSGQAYVIIFLILCALTCLMLASHSLNRLNLREASSGKIEKFDSSHVKKSFPFNRYSNEVLMY
ncbi:MAG: hypothetical protein ACM3UT_08455 [Chloroflexota bacterium]